MVEGLDQVEGIRRIPTSEHKHQYKLLKGSLWVYWFYCIYCNDLEGVDKFKFRNGVLGGSQA